MEKYQIIYADPPWLYQCGKNHLAKKSMINGKDDIHYNGMSIDKIQKFSFSSDGNASDIANLSTGVRYGTGQSSTEHGYVSGSNPVTNVIQKFPFATDANAADVGDLTVSRSSLSGQSSSTHGYSSGGQTPTASNVIDKYTFSSDANATDVGDLLAFPGRYLNAGQSSTTFGYNSGGSGSVIEKFSFSSDGNSSDVGDLFVTRYQSSGGAQY